MLLVEILIALSQGVKRLFVLAYDATDDNEAGIRDNKKNFLPRGKIENYNLLIDGRNFMINQLMI